MTRDDDDDGWDHDRQSLIEVIGEPKQMHEERDENELLKSTVTDCRIEIERLTAERDEARREVCESEQYCVDRSREEAERRGWDCYKEETP